MHRESKSFDWINKKWDYLYSIAQASDHNVKVSLTVNVWSVLLILSSSCTLSQMMRFIDRLISPPGLHQSEGPGDQPGSAAFRCLLCELFGGSVAVGPDRNAVGAEIRSLDEQLRLECWRHLDFTVTRLQRFHPRRRRKLAQSCRWTRWCFCRTSCSCSLRSPMFCLSERRHISLQTCQVEQDFLLDPRHEIIR